MKIKFLTLIALLTIFTLGAYAQPTVPSDVSTKAFSGKVIGDNNNSHSYSHGGQHNAHHNGHHGYNHNPHHNGNHGYDHNPHHHGNHHSGYGDHHHRPGYDHHPHHRPHNDEYDDDEEEYYDDDDDDQQYSDNNSNQSTDEDNNNDNNSVSDNSDVDLNLGAIKDPMIREAVEYLNAIRSNPAAYSEEIGVDLSNVVARHPLRWNEALGRAAQAKAQDMADRQYLAHVDPDGYGMNYRINAEGYTLQENWYEDKSKNNFESCASNWASDGKHPIKQLIYDGGADQDNAGHRVHLLGIRDFWSDCYDIGIGMAKESNGKCKWSVLIAKHHHNQDAYSDK